MTTIVLGSASEARAAILRRAGIPFRQHAADIDEAALVTEIEQPRVQAQALATAKAHAVADTLLTDQPTLEHTYVIAADSIFEFDGKAYGKPHRPEIARQRWQAQRGNSGTLHTGHCIITLLGGEKQRVLQETVSAQVTFANASDEVIDDYIATGEPLGVAGGFTLEGHGATMISAVDGDPNAVLGLSLRAVREQLQRVGVELTNLWNSNE